jgi:hypothetical protein
MNNELIYNLKLKHIKYPNLKSIESTGDGNCFFHSILKAVNINYFKSTDRSKFASEFRKSLAEYLNSVDSTNICVYDKLSRGKLREFSQTLQEYSLENMTFELHCNTPVDNRFNELICNYLNIDLYILDSESEDLYITGNDSDILYFNRPSVVILYTPGHYRLVGVAEDGDITDFFHYSHSFIQYLQNRIDIKLK